jgi:small conductance mechanosensitive channel
MRLMGVETGNVGLRPRVIAAWTLGPGLRALLIAGAAFIVVRILGLIVERLEDRIRAYGIGDPERRKRARTIGNLVQNLASAVIYSIAGLMILHELDIDIRPVLTGAGIIGVAVGFGAQTLVRDIISGFFVILEDQVRVGDTAVINNVTGTVEEINLRTILLRDGEGTLHVFPNGAVTTLANRTRGFAFAVVNIGVSYEEDIDRVIALLHGVGDELTSDEAFRAVVLGPLEILGVEALTDTQVTIQVRIKTLPLKHMDVARELRRRVKRIFDTEGIRIPYRQITMQVALPEKGPGAER